MLEVLRTLLYVSVEYSGSTLSCSEYGECSRADASQRNLRSAAYEALMEMVKNSPKVHTCVVTSS